MGCVKLRPVTFAPFVLALAMTVSAFVAWAAPAVGTRYLHSEHRGDVTVVIDRNGQPVASRHYGPWGQAADTSEETAAQVGFTGQEHDAETGLDYFNARYYDAASGRFLSPDPLRQFHSPYLYAFDAPLKYVDPTGEGGEIYVYAGDPLVDATHAGAPKLVFGALGSEMSKDIETMLRYAYWYEAAVYMPSLHYVVIPTKLSTNPDDGIRRFENVITAYTKWVAMEDEARWKYYKLDGYQEWISRQPNNSVVAVYDDHGEYYSKQRLLQFNRIVKDHSNRYIACVDTGCGMYNTALPNHMDAAKAYNKSGLGYFSSAESVAGPALYKKDRLLASGGHHTVGDTSRPNLTLGDWKEYEPYARRYAYPDGDQAWMLSAPDSVRNRIVVDHSVPHKKGEPIPLKSFRFK